MKTFGLLCFFAVLQQCAAETDWDAVLISTVVLGGTAVFFILIAAITVCCICCNCCRPLMCCEGCFPFNYYGSAGRREYTPERSESPIRRRTRRSTRYSRERSPPRRRRSNSPRAWEGRNNPYKYSPGYRPRSTVNPKPVKQVPPEIVVVNDRGYAPSQNLSTPMISSSSLQPGQVLGSYPAYQPGYPSNGVQQMSAVQLQNQSWFPEVQKILNQQ